MNYQRVFSGLTKRNFKLFLLSSFLVFSSISGKSQSFNMSVSNITSTSAAVEVSYSGFTDEVLLVRFGDADYTIYDFDPTYSNDCPSYLSSYTSLSSGGCGSFTYNISGFCPGSSQLLNVASYSGTTNYFRKTFNTTPVTTAPNISISGNTNLIIWDDTYLAFDNQSFDEDCGSMSWEMDGGNGFFNIVDNSVFDIIYGGERLLINGAPDSLDGKRFRMKYSINGSVYYSNVLTLSVSVPQASKPSLTQIIREHPDTMRTRSKELTFRLFFDEVVREVDTNDLLLSGTVNQYWKLDSVKKDTGTTYLAYAATNSAYPGTLGINVKGVDTTGSNNIISDKTEYYPLSSSQPNPDEYFDFFYCNLSFNFSNISDNSCVNTADGSITASQSGGFAPLTYQWSNGANTATINGLTAGKYTLTLTDTYGCTAIDSVLIDIADQSPPSTNSASIAGIYLGNNGKVDTLIFNRGFSYSDACGPIKLELINTSSIGCSDIGNYSNNSTPYIRISDVNGNSSDLTPSRVLILDSIKPEIKSRDLNVYLDQNGQTTISPSDIDDGSTDACGIASRTLDVTTFNCADMGSNQVVLTVNDSSSFGFDNSISDTAIVTVFDTLAPTLSTQNINLYLDSSGEANISVSDLNNGTSDACGIASISIDSTHFDCTEIGTNQVKFKAVDIHGNADSILVDVIVVDTIKPSLSVQDLNLFFDANGQASLTVQELITQQSDACGIASVSVDSSHFVCAEEGSNTVKITALDNNGNVTTKQAIVTVSDTTPPVMAAQNVDLYLDQNGYAVLDQQRVDNGSYDVCNGSHLQLYLDNNQFYCADVGSNTVTLYAEDGNHNIDSTTATVTVHDTINPEVITQNIDLYLDANGEASITPAEIDNGSNDSCGIQSISLDSTHFNCQEVGANTVTLYVRDINNNQDSANATITVLDTIKPTVLTQDVDLYLDANGEASISIRDIDNYSIDNCGIQSMSLSKRDFDCSEVGSNTINLIITDNNGNIDSNTAVVTVIDSINPDFGVQHRVVYLDSNGSGSITSSDLINTVTDNCGVQSIAQDTTFYSCADLGNNDFTLYATDVNGNLDSAISQAIVVDTMSPQMQTQDITVYLNPLGEVSITPNQIDDGSQDNCGIFSWGLSQTQFNCSEVGNNTVTLSAIDLNGNTSSKTAVVSVLDTTKPIVLTQDVDLYLDQNGQANISTADINNGSSDNCGIASIVLDSTAFDCSEVGMNTITLTIMDVNGNVDSASATVNLIDTLRPIVVAQNLDLYLDANGLASITPNDLDNGSSDNCGIQNKALSQSSFDCSHEGPNNITLYITDVNGNQDSATVVVNVIDTVKPTVITKDTTLYLDQNGLANITEVNINDGSFSNCSIQSISLDSTQFDCSEVGANTVWLTVTDIYNNVDSASAVVNIVDTIAPSPLVRDTTLYLDQNGTASITASMLDDGSYDNCAIATSELLNNTIDCSRLGTNDLYLRITDVNGNVDSVVSSVQVLDTIKPQISGCPSDFVVSTDNGNCTAVVNWTIPTATDNCSMDSLVTNYPSGTAFPIGTTTVTYIAYDQSMNTDTCQFTITVSDQEKPVISNVPADRVVGNDSSFCSAVVNWNEPTAADNCGIDSLISDYKSGDTFPLGVTTVTYIAYDAALNTDTISFTITVEDRENPTIVCRADTVICDQAVVYDMPIANDNCPGVSINQIAGLSSGSFFPYGTTENIFVATDGSGNTDTCSFFVTVYETPTVANAGNDTNICLPSISLYANTPTAGFGKWTALNDSISFVDSSVATTTASGLQRGENILLWIISNGNCSPSVDTVVITFDFEPSEAIAGEDMIVCDLGETSLKAVDPSVGEGSWSVISGNATFSDGNAADAVASNLNQGWNSLLWTTANGTCQDRFDTLRIKAVDSPVATVRNDTTVFKDDGVQLSVKTDSAIASYQWSPSFSLNFGNIQNPFARPEETTEYTVEVMTEDGCTDRDSVTITINSFITIPSAFTPDNDGINDTWDIKNTEEFVSVKVSVYDDFGKELLSTSDYSSWDGRYQGSDLPVGSYYYSIEMKRQDGTESIETGIVSILR